MNWRSIAAAATRETVDEIEALLWASGAVSVSVEDGADAPLFEPGPGETPLWQAMILTGLFEEDVDHHAIVNLLVNSGHRVLQVEEVLDRPWEREWLSRFEAMQFGERLWVCPTGREVTAPDAIVLHLDPGLAFGTGTHPTTRLCLEWLAGGAVSGRRVLDYGCGSGILALAALLMGAASVAAVDNDPQAITATADNAQRNKVSDRLAVFLPKDLPREPVDILVANILAQPLVDLSDQLQAMLVRGGKLVLSGIMESQVDWVLGAYPDIAFEAPVTNEGWARLNGTRR